MQLKEKTEKELNKFNFIAKSWSDIRWYLKKTMQLFFGIGGPLIFIVGCAYLKWCMIVFGIVLICTYLDMLRPSRKIRWFCAVLFVILSALSLSSPLFAALSLICAILELLLC